MAIVYLEELAEKVPNKYLAVNVIAKRARSLNDELLGAGLSQKQKPVSVATEELATGKLSYRQLDPDTAEPDTQSIFTLDPEATDEGDGEDHLVELYGEDATEEGAAESEERATEPESEPDEDTE